MSLRRRSRVHSEVSTHSLNDIMFFLMLFFLIVSTMANPSVIKLMLPRSQAAESVTKQKHTLSIDASGSYFLNDRPVVAEDLENQLRQELTGESDPLVVLKVDQSLTVQKVVDVISVGNKVKAKMVLATRNEK
jgi:biopolymer transport protein ExbD